MTKIDENTKISELPGSFGYLAAVGAICAHWQSIEQLMELKIWKWAGLSRRRGVCFTAHMGFPLRCDVFRSLAHLKFQNANFDKSLNKFIENRLRPTKAVRDRFAHANWLQERQDKIVFLEKPSRISPELIENEISMREIGAATVKVVNTLIELILFIDAMEGKNLDDKTRPEIFGAPSYVYDQILAERTRRRAKSGKRPRPAQSSQE